MAEPRVLLDGTPLLGERTGIGRYTACLAREMAALADVRLIAFTARGWRELRSAAPSGTSAVGVPFPARALRACWSRMPFPPVELFGGRADVVHGTNFVLPPSLRGRGVLTLHDLAFLDEPENADRDLPDLVRSGARRAAVICTPTEAVAEVVAQRLRVPRSKIAVTPLGVDREWFDATPADDEVRRRHGLPQDYLIFVGARGPRKGWETLERAVGPELPPLVVVGPGEPGRSGRVIHTGYLIESELRAVVASARALVLPSRDEGFGLPALEAMACGTPVVCSDIPALREVTAGHAFLFDYGDVESLREALRSAVEADGGAARSHATRFTWRACAEATLAAYRR